MTPSVRRAVVFAAGDLATGASIEALADLSTDDAARIVIAADGGLAHALALGLTPDAVVGDLDSADPADVDRAVAGGAEVAQHPADKGETDLELALEFAVGRGANDIVVVGLFGGRIDHELANVGLLASTRWRDAGVAMAADDGVRRVHVVHDAIELAEPVGTTISVLPWAGPATGVSERGMKWDLDDATLPAGAPLGMSNVAVAATQSISVRDGVLLVIVDRSEQPEPD